MLCRLSNGLESVDCSGVIASGSAQEVHTLVNTVASVIPDPHSLICSVSGEVPVAMLGLVSHSNGTESHPMEGLNDLWPLYVRRQEAKGERGPI